MLGSPRSFEPAQEVKLKLKKALLYVDGLQVRRAGVSTYNPEQMDLHSGPQLSDP